MNPPTVTRTPLGRAALCAGLVLAGGSLAAQPPEGPEPEPPVLTAILVPEVFKADEVAHRVMLFGVEGKDLTPGDTTPIFLWLKDAEGEEVEAVFTHEPTVDDLVFGRGQVGLDVIASGLPPGRYEVCGAIASLTRAVTACSFFQVALPPLSPCELAWVLAVRDHPDFGCQCRSGAIRAAPADSPDSSLGQFTAAAGGNHFGEFHQGDVSAATLTSNFKFEAHFEVDIVNDPGRPQQCSDAEWQRLTLALCDEGQMADYSIHLRARTQREEAIAGRHQTETNSVGRRRLVPYDPMPRHDNQMTWDGHGYRVPGSSLSPAVSGNLKSHDAPNLIHWLDAPGLTQAPGARMRAVAPAYQDTFFWSFVHAGGGGNGDCDCTYGLRTGVVDADGSAGASSVIRPVDCAGCQGAVLEGPRTFRACYTKVFTRSAIEAAERREIGGLFRDSCVLPCHARIDVTATLDRAAGMCQDLSGRFGVWADIRYTASCR
jgi:hypothetical protein